MPGFLLPFHVLSFFLLGQLASCQVDIRISQLQPDAAIPVVKNLVGFSLEADRLTDWVGNTSRNDFFFNTLDNLQKLTGEPPQIRIGANSADNTLMPTVGENPEFAEEAIFPAPTRRIPYPEATNFTINAKYCRTAQFLPPNTQVIWGVNLKRNLIQLPIEQVMYILHNSSSPPEAIEVGNEADLYQMHGARPKKYTVSKYVEEWKQFAGMIALVTHRPVKFWAASFTHSSHSVSGFSPQAIFNEGVTSAMPSGSLVSTVSQHHYSGNYCLENDGGLQDLMSKTSIRRNLTAFTPDIAATIKKGFVYVLGETNSYACHGAPGVSNTAGAALWALDYLLFASQLNITRVFFHNGIGFKYNLIQPVTLNRSPLDGSPLPTPLPPHIQPQYYAAIIAAEAIGNSGNTKIIELKVSHTSISGYAFYQDRKLKRVILIHLEAFEHSTKARTIVHVNLTFGSGDIPSQMNVKRLFVPHADDTSGLTWGGQTYETSDGRVSGSLGTSTVNVSEGVDIQATEVVMLTFIG